MAMLPPCPYEMLSLFLHHQGQRNVLEKLLGDTIESSFCHEHFQKMKRKYCHMEAFNTWLTLPGNEDKSNKLSGVLTPDINGRYGCDAWDNFDKFLNQDDNEFKCWCQKWCAFARKKRIGCKDCYHLSGSNGVPGIYVTMRRHLYKSMVNPAKGIQEKEFVKRYPHSCRVYIEMDPNLEKMTKTWMYMKSGVVNFFDSLFAIPPFPSEYRVPMNSKAEFRVEPGTGTDDVSNGSTRGHAANVVGQVAQANGANNNKAKRIKVDTEAKDTTKYVCAKGPSKLFAKSCHPGYSGMKAPGL